ncbi:MAG: TRAP transporter substrate-binding protein [Rhodospirillales bacterium]
MKFDYQLRRYGVGVLGAAAFATASLLSTVAVGQQSMEMKIGFATINDIQHEAAKIFAADIEKATNGRIKGRLFPAAQLGGIPRQVEGVQLGTQEMFIGPPGFTVGLNPAVQVIDAPAIFDDRAHAERTLSDPTFRAKYLALTAPKGVEMISLHVYDFTWFATLSPIRTLDDLKGKKIRVLASKIESEAVAKWGGAGVPMDYAEVLNALAQRTIDGVRSSIVVMGGSKFFTVTKSITEDGTGLIPSVLMVSGIWLKGLPADLQAAVRQVGRDADAKVNAVGREMVANAEKLWRDNGAEVIKLSAADRKKLFDAVRPLGDQYLANNPATKEMYDLLKQTVEKTRTKS